MAADGPEELVQDALIGHDASGDVSRAADVRDAGRRYFDGNCWRS